MAMICCNMFWVHIMIKWANIKSSSTCNVEYKIQPGYNDIGLCDSSKVSDILWYQLFLLC